MDDETFTNHWYSGRGDWFKPEYRSELHGYENQNGTGDGVGRDQGNRILEENSSVGWVRQNKGSSPYRWEGDKNRVDKQGDSGGLPFDIHAIPPIIKHTVEPVKFDGNILDSLNHFQLGYRPGFIGHRGHMHYRHLHHGRNWLFKHHIVHRQHMCGSAFGPSLTNRSFRDEMNRADTSSTRDRMLFSHSYLSPSISTKAEYDQGSIPFTNDHFLKGMGPQLTFYKIDVSPYLPRRFARRMPPTSSLFHRFYQTPITTPGSPLIPADSWPPSDLWPPSDVWPPSDLWPPPGIRNTFQKPSTLYDNFPDPESSNQLQGAASYNYSPGEPDPIHSTMRMESFQRAPPNRQIIDSNYRIARILMGFPL